MATNTLAGVNIDRIAERSLDYLASNGLRLDLFTTDLAGGVKERGETVTTRFATSLTTQDLTASKATQNATTVKRTVTLDQYHGVPIGFGDLERSYTDRQLDELFVGPAIEALQEKMIGDALGLLTTANGFNTDQTVSAAGAFSADVVADIAQTLSDNKVGPNRNLILPPAYLNALVKDGAIQDASSYGSPVAIREGRVPRLHGFNVIEYTGTIPSNSENMTAVAAAPQGLVIAAREVAEPEAGTWFGQVRSVTDSATGMPIQIRKYYDQASGEQIVEWGILYGVQIGVIDNVSRIVSA